MVTGVIHDVNSVHDGDDDRDGDIRDDDGGDDHSHDDDRDDDGGDGDRDGDIRDDDGGDGDRGDDVHNDDDGDGDVCGVYGIHGGRDGGGNVHEAIVIVWHYHRQQPVTHLHQCDYFQSDWVSYLYLHFHIHSQNPLSHYPVALAQ